MITCWTSCWAAAVEVPAGPEDRHRQQVGFLGHRVLVQGSRLEADLRMVEQSLRCQSPDLAGSDDERRAQPLT